MELIVFALVAAVFVFAAIMIAVRLTRRGSMSGDGAGSTWIGGAYGSTSHHNHHSHDSGSHGGFDGHDGAGHGH